MVYLQIMMIIRLAALYSLTACYLGNSSAKLSWIQAFHGLHLAAVCTGKGRFSSLAVRLI